MLAFLGGATVYPNGSYLKASACKRSIAKSKPLMKRPKRHKSTRLPKFIDSLTQEVNRKAAKRGLRIVKILRVTSTSYNEEDKYTKSGKNPKGLTACGRKPSREIFSVDPSVIPSGTKMYVEGTGFGFAGDKGRRIKGNRVDVYRESVSAALQYGRRSCYVFILKPIA